MKQMTNYSVAITLTGGGLRTSVVAYNSDLSPAGVRAAVMRRAKAIHGKRLIQVTVTRMAEPSGIANQKGMV